MKSNVCMCTHVEPTVLQRKPRVFASRLPFPDFGEGATSSKAADVV